MCKVLNYEFMMFLGKVERRTMSLNGSIKNFKNRTFKLIQKSFKRRKVDRKEEKNNLASCEFI